MKNSLEIKALLNSVYKEITTIQYNFYLIDKNSIAIEYAEEIKDKIENMKDELFRLERNNDRYQ